MAGCLVVFILGVIFIISTAIATSLGFTGGGATFGGIVITIAIVVFGAWVIVEKEKSRKKYEDITEKAIVSRFLSSKEMPISHKYVKKMELHLSP